MGGGGEGGKVVSLTMAKGQRLVVGKSSSKRKRKKIVTTNTSLFKPPCCVNKMIMFQYFVVRNFCWGFNGFKQFLVFFKQNYMFKVHVYAI